VLRSAEGIPWLSRILTGRGIGGDREENILCVFGLGGCYCLDMTPDGELLRRYAESASEEAFGELVRRHLDLVYSAALRQLNGDAHLAQDVAQAVFNDLARKAASLTDRAMLAGWLYTSTHYAAAKAVRTEQRRQAREQEAQDMHELLREPGPNHDWESLRPLLDAAMQELGEPDREIILLRYFRNQAYPEIGEATGLSENAARMRAERALDKLRVTLSRQGVISAAALSTALSVNAVTAAPAGLAATIISGATLAGAGATSGAIAAATKALTMTTLQKTLFAGVVAIALGTGIYGSVQTSQLHRRNEQLQQQQSVLTAQLQEVMREHADATNRLVALAQENQELRSEQKQGELLKLRGQVGALRRSLSDASASNRPSTGIAKMMSDPAMREYIHQTQMKLINERYGPLMRELKLSPEDGAKFADTVGQMWMKYSEMGSRSTQGDGNQTDLAQMEQEVKADVETLGDQLKSLLGDTGFKRYEQFTMQIPAQTAVKMLNDQLGDNSLSEDQNARLVQIVAGEPYDSTHGMAGELDKAFFGSQQDIDNHLEQVTESNRRILDQAAGVLNPQQLQTFSNVLSNSFNAQKLQGMALTQKK